MGFDPRGPEFYHAMLRLAQNRGLAIRLGEQAQQRFRDHFTVRVMADQYQALYQQAVRGKSATRES